jgi:hypothetical protein
MVVRNMCNAAMRGIVVPYFKGEIIVGKDLMVL